MARRLPPLNALRAFEAAARLGSFVAAAAELHVSAAAVSQQVRRLERYLDTDLFQRLARGLILTEEGRAFLPELSRGFENGQLVSLEGSWEAGVEGARPGIIMKAAPMVGDLYRQEFSLANAEDVAEVTSTTGTESVPAASCSGTCVVTRDFSPLEPDAEEQKFYAPGVGVILEIEEDGGRVELVS